MDKIKQTCNWTEDNDGNWETECQNMFIFITDNPINNKFKYCPFCGKLLEQILKQNENL